MLRLSKLSNDHRCTEVFSSKMYAVVAVRVRNQLFLEHFRQTLASFKNKNRAPRSRPQPIFYGEMCCMLSVAPTLWPDESLSPYGNEQQR